jgi:hypothetical protein
MPEQQRLMGEIIFFDGRNAIEDSATRLLSERRKSFAQAAWARKKVDNRKAF